jgi:hypothetical protein
MSGASIVIAGANFSGKGLPGFLPLNSPPVLFGGRLASWFDPTSNLVTSGGGSSWTDKANHGVMLAGTLPLILNANGVYSAVRQAPGASLQDVAGMPSFLNFDTNQAFTVSMVYTLLAYQDASQGYAFYHINSAEIGWSVNVGRQVSLTLRSATGLAAARGGTTLTVGTPYIVQVSYDGSGTAGGIRISINGVAETMTVTSDTLAGSSIAITSGVADAGLFIANSLTAYGQASEILVVTSASSGDVSSGFDYLNGRYAVA